MKKKGILMSMISTMCVGLAAGCNGGSTYYVEAAVENKEHGYATGSGNYSLGDSVVLKFYPNYGCGDEDPVIWFETGEEEPVSVPVTKSGDGYYYINQILAVENVGKYTAEFACSKDNNLQSLVTDNARTYDVKFIVYEYANGTYVEDKDIQVGPDDGKVINNIINIKSGFKITDDSKLYEYNDKIEGKITWYKKDPATNGTTNNPVFNFSDPITREQTLYGVYENFAPEKVVLDAINNFKNAPYMKAQEREKQWYMGEDDNIEDGFTADDSEIGDLYVNKTDKKVYVKATDTEWEELYDLNDKYGYYGKHEASWYFGDKPTEAEEGDLYLDNEFDLYVIGSSGKYECKESLKEKAYFMKLVGGPIGDNLENNLGGTLNMVISLDSEFVDVVKIFDQEGYYDKSNGSNLAGFKLTDASFVKIPMISDIYKFIEIVDVKEEDIVSVSARPDKVENNYVYDVEISNGETITLHISKGMIKKVVTKENTITYYDVEGTQTGINVSTLNPRKLSLVRLFFNEAEVATEDAELLSMYSKDYDTLLKATTGQSLNYLIKKDIRLSKVLKKYTYKVRERNGDCNTNSALFNSNKNINNHVGLCVDIIAKFSDVETAIKNTGIGKDTITGRFELKLSGPDYFDPTKLTDILVYYVNSDLDRNNIAENITVNQWNALWDNFDQLNDLIDPNNPYGKFEYTDDGWYNFYEETYSSKPYLSLKLDGSKRVEEMKYTKVSDTETVTLTVKFDYAKHDALELLKKLENGGFSVNNQQVDKKEDGGYLYDENSTGAMKEVMDALKDLNENSGDYTYNKDENKFEKEGGSSITFETDVNTGNITNVVIKGENDIEKTYEFDYTNLKGLVDDLLEGDFYFSKDSRENNIYVSERNYKNVTIQGENISDKVWEIISALKAISGQSIVKEDANLFYAYTVSTVNPGSYISDERSYRIYLKDGRIDLIKMYSPGGDNFIEATYYFG